MKIGTIGTSAITSQWIQTAQEIQDVSIEIIYSRNIEKAQKFAKEHHVMHFTDSLEDLFTSELIDTVYIASPNTLHFGQAKEALEKGKNVILEKPFVSKKAEADRLFALAREKNLFIFEAISNLYMPYISLIQKHLPWIGDIKWIQMNYSQYSSRYDAFKEGQRPNIFNPNMAGGALMDLNVYNLHLMMALFGLPIGADYFPNIERGIDTSGMVILRYPSFNASLLAAKDSMSESFMIIQGEKGYIKLEGPSNHFECFKLATKDKKLKKVFNVNESRLYPSIHAFQSMSQEKQTPIEIEKQTSQVVEILEKLSLTKK